MAPLVFLIMRVFLIDHTIFVRLNTCINKLVTELFVLARHATHSVNVLVHHGFFDVSFSVLAQNATTWDGILCC